MLYYTHQRLTGLIKNTMKLHLKNTDSNLTKHFSILSTSSIFSLFLLFGFTAVSLFAPIIKSNASESFTSKISTEINPVIAITSPEELSLELLPTPAGTFTSGSVDVDVSTNAFKGYELYLSAKDTDTFMKSELNPSDTTNRISSSFTGSVTSSTMAKNAWGYSLNSTDFSAVPAKTIAKKIKDITTLPTAPELKTTVHFGAKVDTTLDSGRYKADILFTAVAHPNPAKPLHSISTMQQMTPEVCAATTTPLATTTQLDTDGSHHGDSNYVPTKTLVDTRDNNTYTVSKLADGRCWMTQNLRIIDKTIPPADSDVTANYTIPASSISGFSSYDISNAYVDNDGGFYNWYTATAGTGIRSFSANDYTAPASICPKGWRLPVSGSSSEFQTLYNNYNSSPALRSNPVNLTLSGIVSWSSRIGQGLYGEYWTSMVDLGSYAYGLYLDTSIVSRGNSSDKKDGFSVRCIAR